MKPNLILSSMRNLEYDEVAPFFESLRATGSTAQIHFFVSGVSEDTLKKITKMGATYEKFSYFTIRRRQPLMYLWPIWKPMLAKRDFAGKRRLGKIVLHLMSLRFIYYYEFLQARPGQYENILLSDCRDLYFQRDPFSDNLGPGLHAFLEARTQIIGTCWRNSQMVRDAFGPGVLAELATAPVSCAGTTIGDQASIMAYLQTLLETLCLSVKMNSGNDQGVHNGIVHRNMIPGVHIHDNYSSTVYTAGCESSESTRFNDAGEIIRQDGEVYPILHQIDRHEATYRQLVAKLNRA